VPADAARRDRRLSTIAGWRNTASVSAARQRCHLPRRRLAAARRRRRNTDAIGEIEAVLRECGIKESFSSTSFPYEFCDDCGAALPERRRRGTVHAELPEHASNALANPALMASPTARLNHRR
jgi:hypothetical protein